MKYEGYRSGMYVRLEVGSTPCEMVENFSPSSPLIMGGLLLGCVQVSLKKHRCSGIPGYSRIEIL